VLIEATQIGSRALWLRRVVGAVAVGDAVVGVDGYFEDLFGGR
jgi:hypothetical protein